MIWKSASLLMIVLLSACANGQNPNACPPLKSWSKPEQKILAKELNVLSPDSLLITAMEDYKHLRDEVRACRYR